MNKKAFIPKAEKFVRQIVKLALELPQDKIGSRAKRELITSSTQAVSNLNLASLENIGKESVSKLNLVMELIGKTKFWLNFLKDEGYLEESQREPLVKIADEITSSLLYVRQEDEKQVTVSYPGEWFLDD